MEKIRWQLHVTKLNTKTKDDMPVLTNEEIRSSMENFFDMFGV